MCHARLAFAAFVLTLTLLPSSAAAQDWSQPWADPEDRPPRVDFSASAGFLVPTRWSSLVLLGSLSSVSGVLEQVLSRDLRVEPDKEYSAAATYWRSRYGVRAQAGFSRSSLKIGGVPLGTAQSADDRTSVGIDTWLYDVRAAIGFLDYAPSRRVWPYGFVGLGGITYHLKNTISPPLTFVARGPTIVDNRGNTVVIADQGRQFLLAIDELSTETVFAVNAGLGTDVRLPLGPGGVGLRFEISDQMAASPLGLRITELSSRAAVGGNAIPFRAVHHLSATAGLVVQIGR
jgi:opacity protein-like surface antigen